MKKIKDFKEFQEFFKTANIRTLLKGKDDPISPQLQVEFGGYRFGVVLDLSMMPDTIRYHHEIERLSDNCLFPFMPSRLGIGEEKYIRADFVNFAKRNILKEQK